MMWSELRWYEKLYDIAEIIVALLVFVSLIVGIASLQY